MFLVHSLLFLYLAAASAPAGEFLFPPVNQHAHGSSIVEAKNGDLLACWYQGSGERTADDVKVLGARKRAGESAWSDPFLMADVPDLPDCNPVLFIDSRGTLWLFWVTIQNNQWGGALLKYRTATHYTADGPPQWDWQDVIHTRPLHLEEKFTTMLDSAKDSIGPLIASVPALKEDFEIGEKAAHDKLSQRLGWMTRVHPIIFDDHTLMLGLYSDVYNCSLAVFTRDSGATWTSSEPILDPAAKNIGNVQPSFVLKKNGDVAAFMRDNGIPHYVRHAVSHDHGMTWSNVDLLPIRDAGASVECIALKSGRWLLINNDQPSGRNRLSAHMSDDEGVTWKWRRSLERVDKKEDGSFSYPSVTQGADGRIHATYSYKIKDTPGETIKHVAFTEAWIEATAEKE